MNAIIIAAIFIFFILLGPLCMLWALNTLFPALAIPYTGWTWLAAFFLSAPFVSRSKYV
jgi:hypothetical protein